MHQLARRISSLSRSGIVIGADRVKEDTSDASKTLEIIDLADGDTNFPTPQLVVEACIRALEEGRTHYVETGGLTPLREVILEKLGWSQLGYKQVDNIVITPGSKFGLYAVISCLVDPGDSVIILDPYWVSFDHIVRLAEGKPIHIATHEAARFFPDLDELENNTTDSTKAIIINTPNNPTARMYDHNEMAQLLDFSARHNLYVISDEIYSDIEFDIPHVTAAEFRHMHEHLIVVNSFSKAHAMTGWRVGYALGEASLMEKIAQFQQHTITCANSFAQYALSFVLSSNMMSEVISNVVEEFRLRRNVVRSELENVPTISVAAMEGAFYAWIRVGDVAESSQLFAKRLAERYSVAVVPGSVFGASGEGYVRLCYARAGEEKLREALRRLKDCVAEMSTE